MAEFVADRRAVPGLAAKGPIDTSKASVFEKGLTGKGKGAFRDCEHVQPAF